MPKNKKKNSNNEDSNKNNKDNEEKIDQSELKEENSSQNKISSRSSSQISLCSSSDRNLKKYNKEKIPKGIRKAVWNIYIGRDQINAECYVGCAGLISMDNFQCGHIQAESKGGDTDIDNLRPICDTCNQSMGTENMLDYMKKYKLKCPYDDELFKNHKLVNKSKKAIQKQSIDIQINNIFEYTNKTDIILKLTINK